MGAPGQAVSSAASGGVPGQLDAFAGSYKILSVIAGPYRMLAAAAIALKTSALAVGVPDSNGVEPVAQKLLEAVRGPGRESRGARGASGVVKRLPDETQGIWGAQ